MTPLDQRPTPETDAAIITGHIGGSSNPRVKSYVLADFARKLERERDEALSLYHAARADALDVAIRRDTLAEEFLLANAAKRTLRAALEQIATQPYAYNNTGVDAMKAAARKALEETK